MRGGIARSYNFFGGNDKLTCTVWVKLCNNEEGRMPLKELL